MSKTGPKRFVLASAAVMFAMIISVNSASPSSSRDADRYVYPKLAADGNFWDVPPTALLPIVSD
jgi:hypothetical protein